MCFSLPENARGLGQDVSQWPSEKKHCIKANIEWNPEQHRANVLSLQSKHVVFESSAGNQKNNGK